jgi:hypothetical protein
MISGVGIGVCIERGPSFTPAGVQAARKMVAVAAARFEKAVFFATEGTSVATRSGGTDAPPVQNPICSQERAARGSRFYP